ncbi:hypothetical protein HYU92_01690 [Candidatus Curtissbacteria bacterium]|nr:hypothetical protein [Candidatus Curtissbacteria bacterium]
MRPDEEKTHSYDRFTERAHRVVDLSRNIANTQKSGVHPIHLVLGLLYEETEGLATRILVASGIDLDKLKVKVFEQFQEIPKSEEIIGELTPEAVTVLRFSTEESKRLNHHYIGTEHLLLGLLNHDQTKGIFEDLGVTQQYVDDQIRRSYTHGVMAANRSLTRSEPAQNEEATVGTNLELSSYLNQLRSRNFTIMVISYNTQTEPIEVDEIGKDFVTAKRGDETEIIPLNLATFRVKPPEEKPNRS